MAGIFFHFVIINLFIKECVKVEVMMLAITVYNCWGLNNMCDVYAKNYIIGKKLKLKCSILFKINHVILKSVDVWNGFYLLLYVKYKMYCRVYNNLMCFVY